MTTKSKLPEPDNRSLARTRTAQAGAAAAVIGIAVALVPVAVTLGYITADQGAIIRESLLGLLAVAGGGAAIALRRAVQR